MLVCINIGRARRGSLVFTWAPWTIRNKMCIDIFPDPYSTFNLDTKLTYTKINLINKNRENTWNDLITVNMNNTSTTQI
jgi:hypothetical protein